MDIKTVLNEGVSKVKAFWLNLPLAVRWGIGVVLIVGIGYLVYTRMKR